MSASTLKLNRLAKLAVLGLGLGAVSSAGVMALADGQPPCERAHHWAAAHKQDLPKDFDEVSAFPVVYRRAIFSELPADAKASLMQAQLETVLRTTLTARQRAVVVGVMPYLNEELYKPGARMPVGLEQSIVDIKKNFSKKDAGRLFANLGDPDQERLFSGKSAFMVGLHEGAVKWAARAVAVGAQTPNCNCAFEDDWCFGNTSCQAQVCHSSTSGCGLFFFYACNGTCQIKY